MAAHCARTNGVVAGLFISPVRERRKRPLEAEHGYVIKEMNGYRGADFLPFSRVHRRYAIDL